MAMTRALPLKPRLSTPRFRAAPNNPCSSTSGSPSPIWVAFNIIDIVLHPPALKSQASWRETSYEHGMVPVLVAISALCFLGLIFYFPEATAVIWVLTLETSPDAWLAQLIGGHETIIALVKASGI